MENQVRLDETIGTLAARYAGVRSAFEESGIDYYCAGERTVADAAHSAGIDELAFLSRLERAEDDALAVDWQQRSIRDLITQLEHEHHQLLRSIVFHAAMLFTEAVNAHGAECTAAMRRKFRELSGELILHIEKEEHFFFPLLTSLDDARARHEFSPAPGGEVRRSVESFVLQHAAISSQLAALLQESAAIAPIQSEVCHRLLGDLAALQRQIHEYINLENYVVFPRAIALEDDLQTRPPALTAALEGGAS